MRSHGAMRDDEVSGAAWEATWGAVYGAVKWGAFTGILGGIGYLTSPIYRGLTIQFKVYLQMSGMVVGSMIEADYWMRQYEARVRMQRRLDRDRAAWQRFEEEYGKDDDD
ncbi:hypothetical protein M406DRAFT_354610 [Cryphonectria parasitica EP155]|uniref:Imidazoleglycerol-phosphate dehydratase n=1 Tax=Cryphonectria parasitica (strain ATCC 38755 / EP155) TaxID=660469 RepID=A0A9P4YD52_CRYP1|nr:uncharacterized protein M406DRAFT_354610 [Cryphonectria parasitica EP155]KAF3770875.1 hypothetical protein M406DRAFT_354610 [Cryphonectria parasitica EP155]